jgi:uncharacterized repeat protein (TIGR03803 family)
MAGRHGPRRAGQLVRDHSPGWDERLFWHRFRIVPGESKGTWVETILYNFTGGPDGGLPAAGLALDKQGNLYGTTSIGGIFSEYPCPQGCGVVFELSPTTKGWKETVLYSFTGDADGAYPASTPVLDAERNVYGTTTAGGDASCQGGCGVVFELIRASNWQDTTLHTFTGSPSDGAVPSGGIVLDAKGNAYGTTESGGTTGNGTLYELDKTSWSENILYNFCSLAQCADGSSPNGPPVLRKFGIDGATSYGGANNYGTDFHLANTSTGWHLENYSFNGTDGSQPVAPLLLRNRVAYGIAWGGKPAGKNCPLASFGDGVVYSLAVVDGTPTETILHKFLGNSDGCMPTGGLISDSEGNLYGTALQGGSGEGLVYEITWVTRRNP